MDETGLEVEVTRLLLAQASEREPYPPLKRQASPGPASKKAKGKAPISSLINAWSTFVKHFYTKEAQERIHDFESKPIVAKKRVSQETLKLYNTFDLLSGLGCLEMAVFLETYNGSFVSEFYANLTADIDDPTSLALSHVYVRGQVIAFSPAYIDDFLSSPHYGNIKSTRLEGTLTLGQLQKCSQEMRRHIGQITIVFNEHSSY